MSAFFLSRAKNAPNFLVSNIGMPPQNLKFIKKHGKKLQFFIWYHERRRLSSKVWLRAGLLNRQGCVIITKKYTKSGENSMKITLKIKGMSCEHCKMRVEKALSAIQGVSKVDVSLFWKNATIEASSDIPDEKLKGAITEAGYEVTDIKRK